MHVDFSLGRLASSNPALVYGDVEMKKLTIIASVAIGLATCLPTFPQKLMSEPIVFTSGNWTVRRGVDSMTDKVSCTGLHKSGPRVQLSDTGFYVSVQGGVRGIIVRYDDNPPEQMRLATDMEQEIRAVMFNGSDFERVLRSKRVRLEVMTVLDQVYEADLDLSGINAAHDNIVAGCPAMGAESKSKATSGQSRAQGCSEKVLAVLRAKGLSDAAIAEVCSP